MAARGRTTALQPTCSSYNHPCNCCKPHQSCPALYEVAGIERLSDKRMQAAIKLVAAADKSKIIADGGGLVLEVRPAGAAWRRLRYSFAGRENRLRLGAYPEVTRAGARQRRRHALKQLTAGMDPSAVRKANKLQRDLEREAQDLADAGLPGPDTLEAVAREWLTTIHEVDVSAGHAKRTGIRLDQDAFPWIGRRPPGEIEPPELPACLCRVEARGVIKTAHRVKDACGPVFRYATAIGLCKRNPAPDLLDALWPVESRNHAAIVDPNGVGELLRDVEAYQGHPVTRAALKSSALLPLRPRELRHVEWPWLDLEGSVLTVPAEVKKRSRADKKGGPPQLVPLAPQAVASLRACATCTCRPDTAASLPVNPDWQALHEREHSARGAASDGLRQ